MTFALSGWMLYMMWAVLIAMGVNILAGLYKALMTSSFSFTKLPSFLNDVLVFVFPLILLSNMLTLDTTGWLIKIAYFMGGIGIVTKYIIDIAAKLK